MLAQRIPQWLQEAKLQGELLGKVHTLLGQLNLKFGPLPEFEPLLHTVDFRQIGKLFLAKS